MRAAAAELARELAEWRLTTYLRRAGSIEGAPRIFCKVSHSDGRPILFLPSRDRVAGIPEGWVEVTADGEHYQAKFAKIAVNVMTRGGDEGNVLPTLMQKWFGPNAGLQGTTHQVVFERAGSDGAGYVLSPVKDSGPSGPELWRRYARKDVPKLFGFEFKGFESQSGVVTRPGLMLLFVTLDKSTLPEEHRYGDAFESPTVFRWQSQNRTTRESMAGREIAEHEKLGIAVHLFVRAKAKERGATEPFTYCGALKFERWDGDGPITVWWRLGSGVPVKLQVRLGLGSDSKK